MNLRREQYPKGMTLLEVLLVCVFIAIIAVVAIPNYIQMSKRQKGQRSGQNLKILNTAVEQWTIDHYGPPNPEATAALTVEEMKEVESDIKKYQVLLPPTGNNLFCERIAGYLLDKSHIWTSPQLPLEPCYVYTPWITKFTDSNGNEQKVIRAACFSLLDGDPRYEPAGYIGNAVQAPDGSTVDSSYANGFEDVGEWVAGAPRVNAP